MGIDVAKDRIDVATDPPHRVLSVATDKDGLRQLKEYLQSYDVALVVVESTGGYERTIVAALRAADLPVAVVNPARVRDYANACGAFAKTDAIDAAILASFGRRIQPAPSALRSAVVERIDALLTRRRQLVGMRTMERNRIQQVIERFSKKQITQHIKFLSAQITAIEGQVDDEIDSDPTLREKVNIMTSVPGVGDGTACALLAELGELGEASRQQIGALAGVAPFDKQSGKSDRKRTTRGGRTGARTAGYMAALSAQRCNPIIKAFAARLKADGQTLQSHHGHMHSEAVYAPERPVENRYGCGTREPPKQTFEELTLNTAAVPNRLLVGAPTSCNSTKTIVQSDLWRHTAVRYSIPGKFFDRMS